MRRSPRSGRPWAGSVEGAWNISRATPRATRQDGAGRDFRRLIVSGHPLTHRGQSFSGRKRRLWPSTSGSGRFPGWFRRGSFDLHPVRQECPTRPRPAAAARVRSLRGPGMAATALTRPPVALRSVPARCRARVMSPSSEQGEVSTTRVSPFLPRMIRPAPVKSSHWSSLIRFRPDGGGHGVVEVLPDQPGLGVRDGGGFDTQDAGNAVCALQ